MDSFRGMSIILWDRYGADTRGINMGGTPRLLNKNTGVILLGIVVAMCCLTFASVPLYRMFCQKTGYGGTPQISKRSSDIILRDRIITVQFNATVNPNLPWKFKPSQHQITVSAGEVGLAFYRAENLSSKAIVGMATYNVTPEKAGIYFNKVECFCFLEQRLEPRQVMDMPVQFFIDPEIANDPDLADVTTITLSYTFFPYKKGFQTF